jgi:hypothetical protein
MKKLTLFIISLLPMATAADKSYTEEEKDRIMRQAAVRPMYAPASPLMCEFKTIIHEYEQAIRDREEKDDLTRYEQFHEKLKQITDADLLFMLVIFFDVWRWPAMPCPQVLYDSDTLGTEVYLEQVSYIRLLNGRNKFVQETCCGRLEELAEQGNQKASNMLTYIKAQIHRPLNVHFLPDEESENK